MGLAAAKNKRRLGNDPNNTKWSRNTESFGQKMLRSQGWEPGQYLGAKDAAQADRYTEANSSHIKVILKDNNLGLGAKQGGDECTGLFAFQHLLGRLNGKAEDVLEAELVAREDVQRSVYLERRIGTIRFVKGGWLVGDVLKEQIDAEEESKSDSETTTASSAEETANSKNKSKKRKANDKPSKKEKKSKKRKSEAESDSEDESRPKRKSKKSKKRAAEEEDSDSDEVTSSSVDNKASRKEEKKERKRLRAEKREKKEVRRKEKAAVSGAESSGDSISREKKRRKAEGDDGKEVVVLSVPASGASTPVGGSGTSTPISTLTSNRYLSRKRFIAQKTMAFSDAAAMNQIFMIKS